MKKGKVAFRYDKRNKDFVVDVGEDCPRITNLLFHYLCINRDEDGKTMLEKLNERGFDTKTVKLTFERKDNK